MFRKWFLRTALLWAAALAFTACGDSAGGSSGGTPVYLTLEVTDYAEFTTALETIKNDNAPYGGEYTVKISADITVPYGKLISGSKYTGKNIILKGVGGEQTIQYNKLNALYTLFEISDGTLTLDENITLKGVADNTKALLIARDDGAIVINSGAKITGNINLTTGDPDGAGYTGAGGIQVDGGTLVMLGGEISGNSAARGGGVGIWHGGTFTMSGGVIKENGVHHFDNYLAAAIGGGVHLNNVGDVFNMTGGSIINNKAFKNGGGVSVCCGTFTMSGTALVSENTAGGTGGGVALCCCTFNMQGGTISKNIAGADDSQVSGQDRTPFRFGGGVGRWGSPGNQNSFNSAQLIRWDGPVIFHKTGGMIYGSNDAANGNKVLHLAPRDPLYPTVAGNAGNIKGDAVYMFRATAGYATFVIDGPDVPNTFDHVDNEKTDVTMP
ncbi:hypothetical protein AGMMS49940_03200 [Spirochaetia bacterium]|nr:hypothetical protein AGMMS49940_03200 [Spirochaetia bacterium]